MEIPPKYDPIQTEEKWYQFWLDQGFFHAEPDDREPFCVVIPPPNVTGVLHMGHMLNNTIQDVLVRRARMQGKNALWLPGTDHASIATEAKVVAKLKEEGIEKSEIGREAFLEHAWKWKEKHGGIILQQLRHLGASCDWKRTRFTMDPALYESVIRVFVDLYKKGLIYRGVRMVNWDPSALTALSDEDVIYKEVQSKLYYVRYAVEGEEDSWVTIATTRPETILGDTAVCVHPEDERYAHLKGKKVALPLLGRSIPIIQDEYVDREFGTGCLKITPAHDENDYHIGIRHKLPSIDILNDNGTLSKEAGMYVGEDRFEVREKIVRDLEAAGHLVKVEDYTNKVGFSERTDAIIEPKLSMQWFLKMEDMAKPALEAVEDGRVQFHPAKFINTYRHWMQNVRDWCISRQLWWGQRIPAYYTPDGDFVVAETPGEALEIARQQFSPDPVSYTHLTLPTTPYV
jgi:valyl-tRNA synthetase